MCRWKINLGRVVYIYSIFLSYKRNYSVWNSLQFDLQFFLWPPLWFRDNAVVSHPAGPGSIPGRASLLVEVFSVFSSTVRQISRYLELIRPGYHLAVIMIQPISIRLRTVTVSDLRYSTWPSLNNTVSYLIPHCGNT